LILLLTENR